MQRYMDLFSYSVLGLTGLPALTRDKPRKRAVVLEPAAPRSKTDKWRDRMRSSAMVFAIE